MPKQQIRDRLWRNFKRFFVKLPTILWVQWWTRTSGLVGFAKLRTQCKSFGKPTKGVSCWLKVKIFLMQENSKSRMFNYNTCTVLLGCMWLPVSPELPERGGREPESCCCAGFVVTLGKLKSNQEKSIDCFLKTELIPLRQICAACNGENRCHITGRNVIIITQQEKNLRKLTNMSTKKRKDNHPRGRRHTWVL